MKKNYDAQWRSVEAAFQKGLNQTAQKEILNILKQAKVENNTEQYIKALCNYQVSAASGDEQADINEILFFKKEINSCEQPITISLLYSLLAQLYWNYYEENRYEILDRTTVHQRALKDEEIDTWSANDFYQTISLCHQHAIQYADELRRTNIKDYSILVDQGRKTALLRPTLYDLLVHRAIHFFANEEIDLTQPAYSFEINDEKSFSQASSFTQHFFKTSDTISQKYRALQLYKEVLAFHQHDEDPSALIDVDILRLEYVYNHSILPDKKVRYMAALKGIYEKYQKNEIAQLAKYYYAMALVTSNDESSFYRSDVSVMNNEDKKDYLRAKTLAEEIITTFPDSYAAYLSRVLVKDIVMPSFRMETEKILLHQQPSLALLHFRNTDKLYVRVIKMDMNEYKSYLFDSYGERSKLNTRKSFKDYTIQLPSTSDYKNHSTEVKLQALPIGNYAILLSENERFIDGYITTYSFIQVSGLAYIKSSDAVTGDGLIYVVHRQSGEPQENVTVKTLSYQYDHQKQKNILSEVMAYQTDNEGKVRLSGNGQSLLIEVIKDRDDLFLSDNIYVSEKPHYEPITRAFLFTDRGIYRPGQTIYFKGILVLSKGEENATHELILNRDVKVTLFDMNHEVVKEVVFKTNKFGSFSGRFKAPEGLLPGEFSIACENQSVSIRVEEYKRPKFEVQFDTLKVAYRLNDMVKVKGSAKAFAGNNITDAKVKYIITRMARFPYYWCFYRWGMPSSEEMVMAHGTTTTGKDGSFIMDFKAIPDAAINRNSMPVFDYKIEAEITDLNGETRSGKTTISIAYQSMQMSINLSDKLDISQFKELQIETKNMAGVPIISPVELVMKKLKTPLKALRKRLWQKPEILSMSEEEFRRDFPLDEFNDENNFINWKEEAVVWKTVHSSGTIPFDGKQIESGWYLLEAKSKDAFGEELVEKKYFRLYEEKSGALPNEPFFVTLSKLKVEPGEETRLLYHTAYSKPYILFHIDGNESEDKSVGKSLSWQRNEYGEFTFNVSEADRGGFGLKMWYVKDNRFYVHEENVTVPWTNKELKISVETFRDKMFPGSEQKWKLRISGSKKESIASELLASMYDASLDALYTHSWQAMHLYNNYSSFNHWMPSMNFTTSETRDLFYRKNSPYKNYDRRYPMLNSWGLAERSIRLANMILEADVMNDMDAVPTKPQVRFTPPILKKAGQVMNEETPPVQDDTYTWAIGETKKSLENGQPANNLSNIQLRSNFSETAFFFPQLETDESGDVILSFKAPEALTRWKMMAYAHTTDLCEGLLEKESVTQKEIMIVPNTPRFIREGDQMEYTAKITNLSGKDLDASVLLQLENAASDQVVDDFFQNKNPLQHILLKKGESLPVTWPIRIPENFTEPLAVKTYVSAHPAHSEDGDDEFSDGEKNVVPVLLNSMLVTETLPLPVPIGSTKSFRFENLLNSKNSTTLKHYNLSVEYTANPAWYAVQALPYLTDYPYECAEQTFNRYYANALASHIANAYPKIQEAFSAWKEKDTMALFSNLQKNQELKSALLQETPWVLEAKTEQEQKKNLAILFDLNRMSSQSGKTLAYLRQIQTTNGGFSWFKGMPEDRFVTQYIVTGIGRLMHLGLNEIAGQEDMMNIVSKAMPFLDRHMKQDYDELKRRKVDMRQFNITARHIQYLYMRSFFLDKYPMPSECQVAFEYYKEQCAAYWLQQNRYMQAMSAVALYRYNMTKASIGIVESLRENAIHNEELGMYFKDMNGGYYWSESPVETQCMLIECFNEVAMSMKEVDEMKIWLLKNKQTMNWKTTKATADACYALLLNGDVWLASQPEVTFQLGKLNWNTESDKTQEEATGYVKRSFSADEIDAAMGDVTITVEQGEKGIKNLGGITWGAVYWQYFEDLDKITTAETPLKLKKELFKVSSSDRGNVLTSLKDGEELHVGDKVKVRIELRVDREMEYVHMKDMRGACFEPQNVLSEYQYQGGLGYYEATKDMATNFFFDHLEKGTYVFEYPMFVTHSGDFSNGIATIQCMYAPEFSSHSEGIRVLVK